MYNFFQPTKSRADIILSLLTEIAMIRDEDLT